MGLFSPERSDYRIEMWVAHLDADAEDAIEAQLREFLNDSNIRVNGIVAYRVFDW